MCNRFDYNTTWYRSTVPSTNNWVCEREFYMVKIFGYSKIGEAFGSVFFGWLGDV